MNDDRFLLASAYVDDALDADERARAEADPVVMSEVARLRALRRALGDVEPPSVEARERALSAALGAAALGAEAVALSTTTITSITERADRRRTFASRYLAAAAGLVAVGILGVVVITATNGSDDDADTAFDAAAQDTADGGDAEIAPAMSDDSAGGAGRSGTADAAADLLEDAPDEDAGVEPGAEAPTAESADSTAEVMVADSSDPSLPAPDVLTAYGVELVDQRDAGRLGSTPNTACTVPEAPAAEILRQDVFPAEQGPVELLVAIDDTTQLVYALDPDTCEVRLVSPLG